ncbi:permease [Pseudomonas syringae]|nr:permease [Pseudomonas syringae]MBD8789083.1 permease [Pseudomonas syringae]MBD8800473.1 permease [Pseudomonas syringae]MBD8812391.1 permease [Pseudomonas syringae]
MRSTQHKEKNHKIHIFQWTTKTVNQPRSDIHGAFYFCFGTPMICISGFTWWWWEKMDVMLGLWVSLCITTTVVPLIFLAILRQKTVFNYKIQADYGEVEHQLYFPDFASDLFQGIAAFAILIFVGVALLTGSLLFLFGPAAIAAGAAMQLMNWEKPPVEHEKSLPWSEYNFVTVDRKYQVIVTHRTMLNLGFEARFPNKELFEQYLAFLRTALPPSATFTETVWKW